MSVRLFPSNCTSMLQSCDLGIVHSFKVVYGQQLVRKAMFQLESWFNFSNTHESKKRNVLKDRYLISSTQKNVTKAWISHNLKKDGFSAPVSPETSILITHIHSMYWNCRMWNRMTCETKALSIAELIEPSSDKGDDEKDYADVESMPSFSEA